MTRNHVTWVAIDGEHGLWSATLHCGDAHGATRVVAARREHGECLHADEHGDGDQGAASRAPAEFASPEPQPGDDGGSDEQPQ